MNYSNGKMNDIKICYIGGGSRGWAWTFMTDLALEPELSGEMCLYDIDKKAAEANMIIGNKITAREDSLGKWNYTVSDNLKSALTGADFVILSILPGTFDEMASDVHTPERHGIYQSVGDTAGPGGLVRALRTLPMYVEIAEAIRDYAPDAWVINYTNPMSLCVKVLYEVFPEIKAFGCCHEVFGTQEVLKQIVETELDEKDVKRQDIHVNVLGINHFTWFDQASYKGIDLFPVYDKYINEHPEGIQVGTDHWANSSFACAHMVKMDLFKEYGYIAAAGDRHLVEFMSTDKYLKDPETVKSWKFGLTTVDWRKNDLKDRLARSERLVKGEEEVELKSSGEEGILLIKALCGLTRVISNVNIPNWNGQVTNMPADAIVETNAVFGRDSIQPVCAGEIPANLLPLIMPHVMNHELILRAALDCDFDAALQAFKHDPLVQGKISDAEAEALLKDMIKNTKTYLPEGWEV